MPTWAHMCALARHSTVRVYFWVYFWYTSGYTFRGHSFVDGSDTGLKPQNMTPVVAPPLNSGGFPSSRVSMICLPLDAAGIAAGVGGALLAVAMSCFVWAFSADTR